MHLMSPAYTKENIHSIDFSNHGESYTLHMIAEPIDYHEGCLMMHRHVKVVTRVQNEGNEAG